MLCGQSPGGGTGAWLVVGPSPPAVRIVQPYGNDRAGCPVVGSGVVGRGSGAAGRRVDGCGGAAAAILRSGVRYGQRADGRRRGAPVGDDGGVPRGRALLRGYRDRVAAGGAGGPAD